MKNTGWLVKHSPSLLLLLDSSLNCRDIADIWRSRLEAKISRKTSIRAEDLFDFRANPAVKQQLKMLVENGETIANMPVELKLAEGILPARFGAWRVAPEESDDYQIVIAATDVSKYREALQEITQLHENYRHILNAAGDGIYGLDSKGNITFCNAAAETILGWSPDTIMGKAAHAIHHHSHADGSAYPRTQCPIYASLKDGEVHNIEHEVFWHEKGHPVPVEYTSTPLMIKGSLQGAVVVFRDISARKILEEQRAEALKQVQILKNQLEQERDYLRDEINITTNFGEIIGNSSALKRSLAQIESVAATKVSVLVLGESGVGKEMVARAIHSQSQRADKPLVKVNCSSIPKDLFESEFFGHVRGSFTGAHKDRVGRLQLANGGTLFLDEIGEIPIAQQSKLLRALQEGEFERVGDDKTIKVDVRIVAATNRDLIQEIKAGRFREDLYYRINVFPVEVPPLRHRLEDIAPLAIHFSKAMCIELGRQPMKISKHQVETLKKHPWAGNIRELKNVIERAVILSSGSKLKLDDTFSTAEIRTIIPLNPSPKPIEDDNYLTDAQFRALEKSNVIAALKHARGKTWGEHGAAQLLGIKPSTLAYRMKVLGIEKNHLLDSLYNG